MTLEEKVYSILAAVPTVTALVPADRIKPVGNWQSIGVPYLVHFPVTCDPIHLYSGMAKAREWEYQISVFGSCYSEARAVVAAIEALLADKTIDGVRFIWRGMRTPMHESETRLVHIPIDLTIFEAL